MNQIKKLISLTATNCFIVAAFVLWITPPLNAATLTVDNIFYGVEDVIINFNGTEYSNIDAGELQVYFGNNDQYFLPAFCVDLNSPLSYGQNTIDEIVTPSVYHANGIYVEWLMDSFSLQFGYGNKTIDDNEDETAGELWWNSQGAGLQLAIWETLYVDKFSYNEDSVNNKVTQYYNFFIKELSNMDSDYTSKGKYNVVKLSVDGSDTQDLITVVPEPATMLLFGIGLLGIGALGRKRQI